MIDKEALLQEVKFKAIRSSGAGGQHVNKVSSKIELTFNVLKSIALSDRQKERLQQKLQHRLTKDGVLILQCDESRSQHKNKDLVIKRFFDVITKSLAVPKKKNTYQNSKICYSKTPKIQTKSFRKKVA